MTDESHPQAAAPSHGGLLPLALGALGIVYGDIGTSPLYAVKECFHGLHAIALNEANILGVLSLIFWSLTMVVTFKYVGFILRADNRGEGGIFALLELAPKPGAGISRRAYSALTLMGLFGASLLYGESVITPAISVLSAVEGLGVATEAAEPLILPITVTILVGLFMIQKWGTAGIGRLFGPVMIVWFATLAGLGAAQIAKQPGVLAALSPLHAVEFFRLNHLHGMVVLGSVVLCITGGEALYADMGHFGRPAIRLSWLALVFPALLLNYFGQGAGLLAHPDIAVNPFYGIVPEAGLYPMVALSTAAAIIASQAMISGIFSLTRQGVQLGFIPRVRVVHTSSAMEGQIYVPEVNTALMWICIALVLTFRESSRLAAAYGISVTATMTMTSCIFFFVATGTWKWKVWKAALLVGLFLAFDATYFASNLLKFFDGGWFTVSIAVAVIACMLTWRQGRQALWSILSASIPPLDMFLADVARKKPIRLPGAAVFMTVSAKGAPVTLLHYYKHNSALHERVILLSLQSAETPYVPTEQRLEIKELGQGFWRIVARHGFMETPNVPEVMALASEQGVKTTPQSTTFILGRESLLTTGKTRMMTWRKNLFSFMSRNAPPATTYFGIPPNRVMELGVQIEL